MYSVRLDWSRHSLARQVKCHADLCSLRGIWWLCYLDPVHVVLQHRGLIPGTSKCSNEYPHDTWYGRLLEIRHFPSSSYSSAESRYGRRNGLPDLMQSQIPRLHQWPPRPAFLPSGGGRGPKRALWTRSCTARTATAGRIEAQCPP